MHSMLASRLAWVMIPLGSEVVPEVYWRKAVSLR